jgi:hypothetical protein
VSAPQPALPDKYYVMVFAPILRMTYLTVEAVALRYVLPCFCILRCSSDLTNVFDVFRPKLHTKARILSTRNLWLGVSLTNSSPDVASAAKQTDYQEGLNARKFNCYDITLSHS